jgi:hypothetical protein
MYYLDALQIRYRENGQLGIVNISPENRKVFIKAHPEYEFISITPIRRWVTNAVASHSLQGNN